jgi:hypothetical protein
MAMRRASVALVVGLAMGCGGGGGGNTTGPDKTPQGPNLNPSIQRITLDPATVPWGGTATVNVTASDPEGQRLTYRYLVTQGTVTPDPANPARATYTHNGQTRPDRVEVTVTDERNGTAQAAMDLDIALPPPPPPSLPPPSPPPPTPPPSPGPVAPPTVSVSASPRSCHPPCKVTFTAAATGADSYEWSGCAPSSSARGSDSVTCDLARLTPVTATCTVRNSAGSASASASASGTNGAPVVVGGRIIKAIEAELQAEYRDPDTDNMDCRWDRSRTTNCQLVGGCGDFKGAGGASPACKVRMPIGGQTCDMALACSDDLGASGSTSWRLELP